MTTASPIVKDGIATLPDRFVPRFEVYFAKEPNRTTPPSAIQAVLLKQDAAIRAEKGRLDNKRYIATGVVGQPPPLLGQLLPLAGSWGERREASTNDVLSVEFTESVDTQLPLSKVRLELHNVYDFETGLYRYTDVPRGLPKERTGIFPLLEYGDTIALRFGYGATIDWVFEGTVTTLEASFPADGEPKLTVTAVDKREKLRNRKKLKPAKYDATTEEQIASKVAAELGLKVAVTDPNDLTKLAKGEGRPSDQDSLQYLTDRAKRAKLELLCFGDTLFVLKPGDQASEALGYEYRRGLTSFTPTLNGAGKPTRVKVVARDSLTKKTVTGTATTADLQALGLVPPGDTQTDAQASKDGEREEVVTDYPAKTEAEAKQAAIAILKRNLDLSITASGDLIGDPRVRARTTLRIDGVGRFSGAYYVTEATHRFGSNGYQTTFKARRNASLEAMPGVTAGGATGGAS